MRSSPNRLSRLTTSILVALLLGAAATHPIVARAANGPMPCSAFQRNAYGGWRVLAPVTLDVGGRLYSPIVGTVLAAGATPHGIEISDLLDQQCGNR